ncbi:MAG: ABC transporter permease [Spirochaetaceae bacterium]
MKLVTIAWRNLGRNRKRSLLSLSAIAVAALSITLLFALLTGMAEELADNLINHYNGEVRIRHAEYGEYERFNPLHLRIRDAETLVSRLAGTAGVAAVSPRISFPGAVLRDERSFGLRGLGLDFALEGRYQNLETLLVAGVLPEETGREGRRVNAAVGTGVAQRLGLEVGDTFTLLASTMSRGTNAMSFEVTGVLDFPVGGLNAQTFIAPLDAVQRLLRMDSSVTEILLKGEGNLSASQLAEIATTVVARREEGSELSVEPWTEIRSTYNVIEIARVTYGFIALVFFLLGSTVIMNTVMMAVFERREEIGTLAALGMEEKEIVRLFFLETLIMSAIGSFSGVILGVAIALPLEQVGIDLSQAMQGVSMEVSDIIYPQVDLFTTVVVFLASTLVATAASYLPARSAAKIDPVEALRGE